MNKIKYLFILLIPVLVFSIQGAYNDLPDILGKYIINGKEFSAEEYINMQQEDNFLNYPIIYNGDGVYTETYVFIMSGRPDFPEVKMLNKGCYVREIRYTKKDKIITSEIIFRIPSETEMDFKH